MDKAAFVQSVVARVNDLTRAPAAIAHAERLWAMLEAAGYGEHPAERRPPPDTPPGAMRWDGLPAPKDPGELTAGWHPAYIPYAQQPKPGRAEQIRLAESDLAHWQRLARAEPGNADIAKVVAGAKARLDALRGQP